MTYFDDKTAKAMATATQATPKTAVARCIKASNPLALDFPNNSLAPPEKALAALFCLLGCIITAIMINTDKISIMVNKSEYTLYPPNLY